MSAPALELPQRACTADRCLQMLGWAMLAFLLLGFLPLFLCMPLWVDTVQYDIHARNILTGGIPYEQSSDSNLPGIQWIQTAVRGVVGWGSLSIRAVDFAIVTLTIWMLLRWLPASVDATKRLWTLVGLFGCYLVSLEVVHCQRDVWMMPLVLAAVALRHRQIESTAGTRFGASLLEGMIWGLCVWIKPHALLLAAGVYASGLVLGWRHRCWKRWGVDAVGLIFGGAVIGAAGLAWLWHTGAWNHFWEVLLVWSKDYVGVRQNFPYNPGRFVSWLTNFFPWSLIPVLAAPLAVVALWRRKDADGLDPLYAATYLLWFAQAFVLQVPHDYVLMPTMLLGLIVLASFRGVTTLMLTFGVLLGIWWGQFGLGVRFTQYSFPATWYTAITEGPTPELRNRLAVTMGNGRTDWVSLERVADYLREQGVKDGELTCFHAGAHPLFLMLEVKPSIKHIQPNVALLFFPSHLEEIRAELAASKHRFVVSDLQWVADIPKTEIEGATDRTLPASFPASEKTLFPWCEPIVYRAGPYVVHRITEPTRKFWH